MSIHTSLSATPTILVCCDLQEDYRPADAVSALATGACSVLLERWRELRWPVAHLKRLGERQWVSRGAAGPEWLSAFKPRPDELTFLHHLPSAYSSAHFTQYMQTLRDSACVLIGYALDETILATAVDGFHRDHRYYLATEAVACMTPGGADADTHRRAIIAIIQKFAGTYQNAEAQPLPLTDGRGDRRRPGHRWESTSP